MGHLSITESYQFASNDPVSSYNNKQNQACLREPDLMVYNH